MEAELRPLAVGEVLDVAIKLYRSRFSTLVKAVVVVVAPLQVVSVLVQASTRQTAASFSRLDPVTGRPTLQLHALRTTLTGTGVVGIVGLFVSALATAASFRALSAAYLGEEVDWRESLRFALRRAHSVAWITLLHTFVAALGLVLFIAPGVYLYLAWIVAVPVLLLEETKGRRALKRSRQLVKGRWWPTAGAYLLGFLLTTILSSAFVGLLVAATFVGRGSIAQDVIRVIASTAASAVTTPFLAAVVTVLYFDLRVRKEGFDLELLARRVGVELSDVERPPFLAPPPPPGSQPPFWPPPPGWQPQSPPAGGPPPSSAPPSGSQPPSWPPPPRRRPDEPPGG